MSILREAGYELARLPLGAAEYWASVSHRGETKARVRVRDPTAAIAALRLIHRAAGRRQVGPLVADAHNNVTLIESRTGLSGRFDLGPLASGEVDVQYIDLVGAVIHRDPCSTYDPIPGITVVTGSVAIRHHILTDNRRSVVRGLNFTRLRRLFGEVFFVNLFLSHVTATHTPEN